MTNNHQFVTVTRTLIKRGLSDIERKLAVGFTSGAIAIGALNILAAYGVHPPESVIELVPYVSVLIGGWLAHSVGSTTTYSTTNAGTTEVSTLTGPVKIPKASTLTPPPTLVPNDEPEPAPVATSFTSVLDDNGGATQVLPSRAGAFLSSLPSSTLDDH